MAEARREGWRRWWPFVLLCLAASCEWMVTDAFPQAASTLISEAAGCGIAAVLTLAIVVTRRGRVRVRMTAVTGGAFVIAGPVVGLLLGASLLDAGSIALALTLTPVVAAVAESAFARDEGVATQHMWPGLAAAAGLLLLIPVPSFGSPRALAALVLTPLLTGVGCVLFRRTAEAGGDAAKGSDLVAGLAGGAVLMAADAGFWTVLGHAAAAPSWIAVGLDLILTLLALLALSRLEVMRYTSRYALVPLIVLLQGFVLLRSAPTWRSVGCGVLLAMAAWFLVRDSQESGITWSQDDEP